MQSRDENKDYELFGLLKSIDLKFDEQSIAKEIGKLKQAFKLFHPKDNLKQETKRNINSLSSILSAFNRVDQEILKKDFETIKANINEIFHLFKMATGIHETLRIKAKKMVINSLADLDKLKDKVFEVFDEDPEGHPETLNFLTQMTEQCAQELEGKEIAYLNIPLIMNAWSENLDVLPHVGIHISQSKYGTLWSNQYIVAVRRDSTLKEEDVDKLISEKYEMGFDFLFPAIRHKAFPEYVFYWAVPKIVMKNLVTLKVTNFSLPFESSSKETVWDDNKLKELKRQRIELQVQKGKKKNG